MKYSVVAIDGTPIPEDEPVFVLRGRDLLAVRVLNSYHVAVHETIGESEMSRQLAKICVEFTKYAVNNPDKMKLPSPHKNSGPVQIKVNVDGGTISEGAMRQTMDGMMPKPTTVHNESGTVRKEFSISNSQTANEVAYVKTQSKPVIGFDTKGRALTNSQTANEDSFAAKQKEIRGIFQKVFDQALEEEMKRQRKMVENIIDNVCNLVSEYLDDTARGEESIAKDNAAQAFFEESEDAAVMARMFDDRAKHTRDIQDGLLSTLRSRLK